MELLKKITDFLMPEEDEEEEIVETKAAATPVAWAERKVVNGAPVRPVVTRQRPTLTLHTNREVSPGELKVDIFVPRFFDDVASVADALKQRKAAIVNFERLEEAEQRRVCDFVNGVCYVLEGSALQVANGMIMYVPAGVTVEDHR